MKRFSLTKKFGKSAYKYKQLLGCEVPTICSHVVTCMVYVYIGLAILCVVILHL